MITSIFFNKRVVYKDSLYTEPTILEIYDRHGSEINSADVDAQCVYHRKPPAVRGSISGILSMKKNMSQLNGPQPIASDWPEEDCFRSRLGQQPRYAPLGIAIIRLK